MGYFRDAKRLAVRITRQAVWKLVAHGGMCPPPSDLDAAVLGSGFLNA